MNLVGSKHKQAALIIEMGSRNITQLELRSTLIHYSKRTKGGPSNHLHVILLVPDCNSRKIIFTGFTCGGPTSKLTERLFTLNAGHWIKYPLIITKHHVLQNRILSERDVSSNVGDKWTALWWEDSTWDVKNINLLHWRRTLIFSVKNIL